MKSDNNNFAQSIRHIVAAATLPVLLNPNSTHRYISISLISPSSSSSSSFSKSVNNKVIVVVAVVALFNVQ